jgi:hypothetical protein
MWEARDRPFSYWLVIFSAGKSRGKIILRLITLLSTPFLGALAASMLGFVLPGIIYLKCHESELRQLYQKFCPESSLFESSIITRIMLLKNLYVPVFMIFFGTCLLFLGVSTVLFAGNQESS